VKKVIAVCSRLNRHVKMNIAEWGMNNNSGFLRYILGCRGNNASRFARVRERRFFSKRQVCIQ